MVLKKWITLTQYLKLNRIEDGERNILKKSENKREDESF